MVWAAALAFGARLIILYAHEPPVIVPYATMQRCERARDSLLRQSYDPLAGKVEQTPAGGYLMHPPQQVKAYCIPS